MARRLTDIASFDEKTFKSNVLVPGAASFDYGSGTTNSMFMLPKIVGDPSSFHGLLTQAQAVGLPPLISTLTGEASKSATSVWCLLPDPASPGGYRVLYPGSGEDALLLLSTPTSAEVQRQLRRAAREREAKDMADDFAVLSKRAAELLICTNAKGSLYEQAAASGVESFSYVGGRLAEHKVRLYHLASARAATPDLPEYVEAPVASVWTAIVAFNTARTMQALVDAAQNAVGSLPSTYKLMADDGSVTLDEARFRADTQLTIHIPGQAHVDARLFFRHCFSAAFGPGASETAQTVLGGAFDPVNDLTSQRRLAIMTEPRSALIAVATTSGQWPAVGKSATVLLLDLGDLTMDASLGHVHRTEAETLEIVEMCRDQGRVGCGRLLLDSALRGLVEPLLDAASELAAGRLKAAANYAVEAPLFSLSGLRLSRVFDGVRREVLQAMRDFTGTVEGALPVAAAGGGAGGGAGAGAGSSSSSDVMDDPNVGMELRLAHMALRDYMGDVLSELRLRLRASKQAKAVLDGIGACNCKDLLEAAAEHVSQTFPVRFNDDAVHISPAGAEPVFADITKAAIALVDGIMVGPQVGQVPPKPSRSAGRAAAAASAAAPVAAAVGAEAKRALLTGGVANCKYLVDRVSAHLRSRHGIMEVTASPAAQMSTAGNKLPAQGGLMSRYFVGNTVVATENYGISMTYDDWESVRDKDLATLKVNDAMNVAAIDEYYARVIAADPKLQLEVVAPVMERNTAYSTTERHFASHAMLSPGGMLAVPGNKGQVLPYGVYALLALTSCGSAEEAASLAMRPDSFDPVTGRAQYYRRMIVFNPEKPHHMTDAPPQFRKYYAEVVSVSKGRDFLKYKPVKAGTEPLSVKEFAQLMVTMGKDGVPALESLIGGHFSPLLSYGDLFATSGGAGKGAGGSAGTGAGAGAGGSAGAGAGAGGNGFDGDFEDPDGSASALGGANSITSTSLLMGFAGVAAAEVMAAGGSRATVVASSSGASVAGSSGGGGGKRGRSPAASIAGTSSVYSLPSGLAPTGTRSIGSASGSSLTGAGGGAPPAGKRSKKGL